MIERYSCLNLSTWTGKLEVMRKQSDSRQIRFVKLWSPISDQSAKAVSSKREDRDPKVARTALKTMMKVWRKLHWTTQESYWQGQQFLNMRNTFGRTIAKYANSHLIKWAEWPLLKLIYLCWDGASQETTKFQSLSSCAWPSFIDLRRRKYCYHKSIWRPRWSKCWKGPKMCFLMKQ